MKKVILVGIVGVSVVFGANLEARKQAIIEKDQQLIQILSKHSDCVKKATSSAEIKRCNFLMRKDRLIMKLKAKIAKEKAKTGAPAVPKLENQLKCIEKATTPQDLKACKNQ